MPKDSPEPTAPGAAPEARPESALELDRRRNFRCGVANGVLIQGALACTHGAIVLAPLIKVLTGSTAWAGVIGQLNFSFWLLPQMFVSRFIEPLPRKMPFFRLCAFGRLLGWTGAALALFFLGSASGVGSGYLVAGLVTFFVLLNGFANGCTSPAFQDIVAKVVPVTERERFFGLRLFLGRLLQIGMTFVWIPFVLSGQEWLAYPRNYTLLFLTALFFAGLSIFAFLLIREPAGALTGARLSNAEHFRKGWAFARDDAHFRRLLLYRALNLLGGMAFTLLAVYALDSERGLGLGGQPDDPQRFRLKAEAQAFFMQALVLAECAASGLWAWLGGRFSLGAGLTLGVGLRMALALSAAAVGPLMAALEATRETRLWAMAGLFALQGAAQVLLEIEGQSLMLELAPEESRPTFLGFLNSCTFPFMLGCPLLGAFLADRIGYSYTYVLMAVFSLISLFVAQALSRAKIEARRSGAIQTEPGKGVA